MLKELHIVKRNSTKESTVNKGRMGEELAKLYLEKQGYRILDRNFRLRSGELDFILQDPETDEIVAVEVKSLRSEDSLAIEETLGARKLQKVFRTFQYWLMIKGCAEKPYRIDFLGIVPGKKLKHLKNIGLF